MTGVKVYATEAVAITVGVRSQGSACFEMIGVRVDANVFVYTLGGNASHSRTEHLFVTV